MRNTLPSNRHTGRSLVAMKPHSHDAQPTTRGNARRLVAMAKAEADHWRERNYNTQAGHVGTGGARQPSPAQIFNQTKGK
jgi:hypothetical protein